MVGVESDRALLDRLADLRAIRAHDAEITLMDVKDKRVLVVGLGKSGAAAAMLLHEKGARVTVSDAKPPAELQKEIPALLDLGTVAEPGADGQRTFRDQGLIVVSPGVPVDAPQLPEARTLGVPV